MSVTGHAPVPMMRAVQLHSPGDTPRVALVPVPTPGPGEALVRVHACGVCGSDVHIVEGSTRTGQLPLTLGHEAAGVVERLGPDTVGAPPGTPVCLTAGYGCGMCATCTGGAENRCPHLRIPGIHRNGSWADYVVVPARCLVEVPAGVDLSIAAILTDAVATPLHAIRRSGVRAGQTAVVFGLGGLGIHAVAILHQVVGARVIGVDARPDTRERARSFGAETWLDAGDQPARQTRALTGGGADVAFEFVGTPAAVDQALKSLRPGGVCTVVGVGPDPLHLLPQALFVAAELVLQGSFGSGRADLEDLVALVGNGALDLRGTITHRFGLEQSAAALEVVASKRGDPIRVVIEP